MDFAEIKKHTLTMMGAIVLATILSTTWIVFAVLSRSEKAIYLPQAARFLSAALLMGLALLLRARRLPEISLRLFQASVTVSVLAFFLSPILCFFALRTLSSGAAAILYTTGPMWLLIFTQGGHRDRWVHMGIIVAGLALFMYGIFPDNELRGPTIVPVILLCIGLFVFVMGTWVAKKFFLDPLRH